LHRGIPAFRDRSDLLRDLQRIKCIEYSKHDSPIILRQVLEYETINVFFPGREEKKGLQVSLDRTVESFMPRFRPQRHGCFVLRMIRTVISRPKPRDSQFLEILDLTITDADGQKELVKLTDMALISNLAHRIADQNGRILDSTLLVHDGVTMNGLAFNSVMPENVMVIISFEMKLNAFELDPFQDTRKLNSNELVLDILEPVRMKRVEIYKKPMEYEAEIMVLMKAMGMDRRICVRYYNCHNFNSQKALRDLSIGCIF
jgi:hypothetical protein